MVWTVKNWSFLGKGMQLRGKGRPKRYAARGTHYFEPFVSFCSRVNAHITQVVPFHLPRFNVGSPVYNTNVGNFKTGYIFLTQWGFQWNISLGTIYRQRLSSSYNSFTSEQITDFLRVGAIYVPSCYEVL